MHADRAAGPAVLRYAAFTGTPDGGNPAGVVLDAGELTAERMLAIAAEVGYSETAFLWPRGSEPGDARAFDLRYFSPTIEVPFCGHATIASGVALADRDGPGLLAFHTASGVVPVETSLLEDGHVAATLTSVEPYVADASRDDVAEVLAALHWSEDELDPLLPPRIAYAGVRHLILGAATRGRLADLAYDFEALKRFMTARDLTTVDLVWRESEERFHARNPFPVGGVVEDPATGAAAAALGAYLRALELVSLPARITIAQGDDMGRPSELIVDISAEQAAIRVTGRAVAIP